MLTPAAISVPVSPTKSVVTADTPDRPGSGNAQVEVSCGHDFHSASLPPLRYAPGDTYDCARCRMERWRREHPPLPDEQIEAIEATLPKCPECGGAIDTIPFIKRSVHKFYVEINAQNGDVLAASGHHDLLDEEPDWTVSRFDPRTSTRSGELDVQCADGHIWVEKRLAYRYDRQLDRHGWVVLPAESAS